MKIYYETKMTKLPENCLECTQTQCQLPLKCNSRGGVSDVIKKAYLTKRHEECPLRELNDK